MLLPSELGSRRYPTPNFELDIDVRSLTIAYALMTGVLMFEDLAYTQSGAGVPNIYRRDVIHPNFPDIGFVTCYVFDVDIFGDVPNICGYIDNINFHFYVPSIDTYQLDNYSFIDSNCDCPQNARNYACQNYQFLFRILTWPIVNNATNSISAFLYLSQTSIWKENKVQALRDMFRNAYDDLSTICPYLDCVMHHVMLGKDTGLPFLNSYGLSLIQFQDSSDLTEGYSSTGKQRLETVVNCKGSMYHDSTWIDSMHITPVPLIAPYTTCRFTVAAAVQNTIGNANDIATTIAAIILAVFLGVSVQVFNSYGTTCYSRDCQSCEQPNGKDEKRIKTTSRKLEEATGQIEVLSEAVIELAKTLHKEDMTTIKELEETSLALKQNGKVENTDGSVKDGLPLRILTSLLNDD